jgi:hypothetical protein
MNRHAAGFVQDKDSLVLENNVFFDTGDASCRRLRRPIIKPGWRNPHLVAGLKSIFNLDTAAIYAHFAPPDDSVQATFWQAWHFPSKEIVDALASLLLIDSNLAHGRLAGAC